jgi:hypothetical protein
LTVVACTAAVRLLQWMPQIIFRPGSSLAVSGVNLRQIEQLRDSREPTIVAAVLVSFAIVTFAILTRQAIDPTRTFRRLALGTLLFSLVPDLLAWMTSLFGWPLAAVYVAMHVAAWAICVTILSNLGLLKPEA